MGPEESSRSLVAHGHTTSSNGSTPRKPTSNSLNGHSPVLNGSSPSYINGVGKSRTAVRNPDYRGHSREELTRILIQGLIDMGYTAAASTLCSESGYELESVAVAAFRNAILDGNWSEAEQILLGSYSGGGGGATAQVGLYGDGLVLAEGANKEQMLFSIRQQKFLELLDDRDLGQALSVLRQELAPLNHDVHRLHLLSSLLMCPPEDLREQAHWSSTLEESRKMLLQELTSCIAPSVMIRDHRLAELLHQVKDAQIRQCLYHNTASPPSLYADHTCNPANFPSHTSKILEDHTGEVWHVAFSHNGTRLATASQDKTAIIYDVENNFERLHVLGQHEAEVAYVAWSEDDTKLITCSKDRKARVWDVRTGHKIMEVEHGTPENNFAITSAAWIHNSSSFVTTSFDAKAPICVWRMHGSDLQQPVHTFAGLDKVRALECAITPDGRRLIVADNRCTIHVYDLSSNRQLYRKQFSTQPTSLTASRDNRTILINLTECEIHMFDLDEAATVRVFKGQKQGRFVIRSCFGGAAENFVLSGSEDGKVYIWHKENAALIETLKGHDKGQVDGDCVTTVAWNPRDAGMFASGGDDRRVRV